MMLLKMKIPALLRLVLTLVGFWGAFRIVFDVILGELIPASLLTMYMFFVAAGVFMVFTFTEKGTRELLAPIKALVEDPTKKMLRNIVFVIVPLALGAVIWQVSMPSFEAPVELRSIHPAPPSSVNTISAIV